MADLTALSAACQRKQQLERQFEGLLQEEKAAQQALQDSQVRCQKENLDMRKFDSSDFKQFWFKLRGQYEERVLENNLRAAEAMRELNEAKSRVFDIGLEKSRLKEQIDAMAGTEEAYEKAFKERLENLDLSIHRDEILRMQEKISHDDYQLTLLAEARNLSQVALRRVEQLIVQMQDLVALEAGEEETDAQLEIQFISGMSELRIQLHQLETIIDDVDALEADYMHFSNKLTVNTLDLFFNKGSDKLQDIANEKAIHELKVIKNGLLEGEKAVMRLVVDIEAAKELHQDQLKTFISDTPV